MCDTSWINGIQQQIAGTDSSESTKSTAALAADAALRAADIAAEAMRYASDLAYQGLMEQSRMAMEEARAAREQSYAYIREATAQAQTYLDSTLGQTSPIIKKGQEDCLAILDQYSKQAADLYRPYISAGSEGLRRYQELANRGVTLSRGRMVSTTTTTPGATTTTPGTPKSYEDWKAEKLGGITAQSQGPNGEVVNSEGKYLDKRTGQWMDAPQSTGETIPTEEQLQAEYQQYVAGIPSVTTTGEPTTTTTTQEAPYNIEESPYYPLYEYQQEQQQKAIDAGLSARGLYRSGAGLTEQLKADTGLTESFTATEYQRAVDDYTRQLTAQGNLAGMGYEASGNLANIYSATGANKANTIQWGAGSLANLQSQIGAAKANAAMGQGTSLANISQQSGAQLANIQNQLGTNLGNVAMTSGQSQANSANQLGTNLVNIYGNLGSNLASIYNQQAQNRTNMYAGLANTGLSALLRYGLRNNNTGTTTTPNYYADWSQGGTYEGGNYGTDYGDYWAEGY
jgi:hypothetical protein